MQDPDRLQVEIVGAQFGFRHAEFVEDVDEPSDARPERSAQPQPHGVGDLCSQVVDGLAQQRQRAVEECGMFDPVVGEGLKAAAEPLVGVARLLVDGVEQGVDLCQIARGRQCEQLLLGGEVPVDEGLVDADPAGDVVDAGVLCSTLVE